MARVPRSAADALTLAARESKTSAFVMLLTAYAALLSRLSGDLDLVVGTPVGGRPGPDYADVVGFFATVVACRIDLSGALTNGMGHVVLLVEPVKAPSGPRQPPRRQPWERSCGARSPRAGT